ncbi:unnamed protein product, partial [Ixodes hexagonus]
AGSHRRHGHGLGCPKCKPGFAVLRPCGHGLDTVCIPCRPGQFLPHHSHRRHCFPCSLCGEELFTAHLCTPTTDTVCDSCHTQVLGPHAEDFYVKCNRSSTAEDDDYDVDDDSATDDPEDLWQRRESPAELMLVREELSHMRHEADLAEPAEHGRSHHAGHLQKHSRHHSSSTSTRWGAAGGSGTTVVTAVVSICAMAGLLFAVVLSRWRADASVTPVRKKRGYVVVSQASSESSSPV